MSLILSLLLMLFLFSDRAYADMSEGSVNLRGGTTDALIGNTGDRLKVDASFATPQRVVPTYPGSVARYVDMNAGSGGVARGTGIASTSVYTTLFNYSGSGHVFSFLVSFEGNLLGADAFNVKFEIDSTTLFEVNTLDIATANLYNLNTIGDENTMGFALSDNVLRFAAPRAGLYYATNVKVSIKKATSATSKQFRAGAIYLTKET